jgi:hypothetical protein
LDRVASRVGETDAIHEQVSEGNKVGHGDVLIVVGSMMQNWWLPVLWCCVLVPVAAVMERLLIGAIDGCMHVC